MEGWSKTDSEMGYYHHPPPPQRPLPMYQRDPNAYQGASVSSEYHHQTPVWSEYTHSHQQPQADPYYYHHHNHHHHSRPAYEYPTAPPPPPSALPGYHHAPSSARRSSTPPPSLVYVHSSSSSDLLQQPLPSSTSWSSSSPELIYEIRDTDVLCGRGAPSHYHSGNKHFRQLIHQFQSSYLAARRADKPEIATRIVDLVRARGGRFLKRTKMEGVGPCGHFCWQDIGEQRAYEKACQALREGAPNLRAKVAAKEVAAAALCLDNLGRYRSAGSSGSSNTTLPGCSPVRSCAVDEERDDRSPPPSSFKDLNDEREA